MFADAAPAMPTEVKEHPHSQKGHASVVSRLRGSACAKARHVLQALGGEGDAEGVGRTARQGRFGTKLMFKNLKNMFEFN